MFDVRSFITRNLINGCLNGSFTREQVSIYSANYMARGWLTEGDVMAIQDAIAEPQGKGEPED